MNSNIFLGTQGWSYKDWVGPFYPPGASTEQYLPIYGRHFNTVELDTTFYATPEVNRVDGWARATADDFVFTAKVPRSITHDRRLVDADDEMDEFLDVMRRLGQKLGAVLIQLPPDFASDEKPALEAFLESLPADIRFAAEFRHRSWLSEETYALLRRHGIAWTMIDLPYMPITPVLTANFAYIRLLGDHKKIVRLNETQLDREDDLDSWAERLEQVARQVERVYGFVNNHYSGHSPADVRRLRRMLGMENTVEEVPLLKQGSLL